MWLLVCDWNLFHSFGNDQKSEKYRSSSSLSSKKKTATILRALDQVSPNVENLEVAALFLEFYRSGDYLDIG